jgi:adenylate kinase family enzyme
MARVILFRGKPGVGKTTTSNAVSKLLNIAILRKDDIYDGISRNVTDHEIRNQICDVLLKNLIKTNIENNCDIIVDNSCHYINQFQDFKKWVEIQNGELKSILIICSNEETWKNRFSKRKLNPKPNNIITDFETLKEHYGSLKTESVEGELMLDSINEMEWLTQKTVQWLDHN